MVCDPHYQGYKAIKLDVLGNRKTNHAQGSHQRRRLSRSTCFKSCCCDTQSDSNRACVESTLGAIGHLPRSLRQKILGGRSGLGSRRHGASSGRPQPNFSASPISFFIHVALLIALSPISIPSTARGAGSFGAFAFVLFLQVRWFLACAGANFSRSTEKLIESPNWNHFYLDREKLPP